MEKWPEFHQDIGLLRAQVSEAAYEEAVLRQRFPTEVPTLPLRSEWMGRILKALENME